MEKEQSNEWVLLERLRDQLQLLAGTGSEAELNMHSWNNCLGGYAARDPVFNRLGLVWRGGRLCFGPDDGFAALARFFGVDARQADYLFADNPWLTGVDPPASFAEACRRITEIINGEY